ncbi:kinesin-like protein KIF20B [Prorops nasuta]|uniref:kinesin-like protein KIF20B n=1 Tax=Prorops nasuta TaxID=863751 RepID=UPI0034CE3D3E
MRRILSPEMLKVILSEIFSVERILPEKYTLEASSSLIERSLQENEQLDLQHCTEKSVASNSTDSVNDFESPLALQTIKVYLRLKPFDLKQKSEVEEEDVYSVLNDTTLLTKFPPCDNIKATKKTKSDDIVKRKYIFTKVFEPTTSQEDLFEESVKAQVIEFLGGQNGSIITYGTTNSGKTYTMFGENMHPGIVAQSMELIFSTIKCTSSPWYKPLESTRVVALDEAARIVETKRKKRLLSILSHENESDKVSQASGKDQSEIDINVENIDERNKKYDEPVYSVWLSFFEIYNENVYELLNEDERNDVPLKLMKDKYGTSYVRDLKSFYATSAIEALQILSAGQSRATVAQTTLNSKSSRSHSIFSVKLCKYQEMDAPENVEVFTLTFCDLAGCGRSKKMLEEGKRSIEARNINNSLIVLGRCLKAVWTSQSSKHSMKNIKGPFRESKLTTMFQKSLSGQDHLSFIVTLDSSSDLYVDTHGVLNTCAIAKKIVIDEANKESKKPYLLDKSLVYATLSVSDEFPEKSKSAVTHNFSRLLQKQDKKLQKPIKRLKKSSMVLPLKQMQDGTPRDDWGSMNADDCNIWYFTKYQKQKKENKELVKEIEMLKSKLVNHEQEIHEELANNYANVIDDLETSWKERAEKMAVDAAEEAVKNIVLKSDNHENSTHYISLIQQNEDLRKQVHVLKSDAVNRELEVRNDLTDYYKKIIDDLHAKWKDRLETLKREDEEFLKWSVNQLESFYKERITSILENMKLNKDLESNEGEESNCTNCVSLQTEISHVTSKTVVMKQCLKRLEKQNENLAVEKNEAESDLLQIKITLNKYETLAKELIGTFDGNNSLEINNSIALMDRLKVAFEEKVKASDNLENDLRKVKDDNYCVTAKLSTAEEEITRLKDILEDKYIEINTLKQDLFDKTKNVEMLELHIKQQDTEDEKKNSDYCCDTCKSFLRIRSDLSKNVLVHKLSSSCSNYNDKSMSSLRICSDSSGKTSFNLSSIESSSLECTKLTNPESLRSSEEISHDDSGICTSSQGRSILSESLDTVLLTDIHTQTYFESNDCGLEPERCHKSVQINQMSDDLNNIKEMVENLKEIGNMNKRKLNEYDNIIKLQQKDLVRMNEEKSEATIKYHEVVRELQMKSGDYEKKINELSNRLRIKEDSGNRTSKCLEEYLEKSATLETQITALHTKLERSSIKCITEHIPRIEELEKELLNKNLRINDMECKMAHNECDIKRIFQLQEKVHDFENILSKFENERSVLCNELHKRSESLSSLEGKLRKFVMDTVEQESDVLALKTQIGNIEDTNVKNNLKVKELNEHLTDMLKTIKIFREELLDSDETRKEIERYSDQEINNLRSYLSNLEESASLLDSLTSIGDAKSSLIDIFNKWDAKMDGYESNKEDIIVKYDQLLGKLEHDIEKSKVEQDKPNENSLCKTVEDIMISSYIDLYVIKVSSFCCIELSVLLIYESLVINLLCENIGPSPERRYYCLMAKRGSKVVTLSKLPLIHAADAFGHSLYRVASLYVIFSCKVVARPFLRILMDEIMRRDIEIGFRVPKWNLPNSGGYCGSNAKSQLGRPNGSRIIEEEYIKESNDLL